MGNVCDACKNLQLEDNRSNSSLDPIYHSCDQIEAVSMESHDRRISAVNNPSMVTPNNDPRIYLTDKILKLERELKNDKAASLILKKHWALMISSRDDLIDSSMTEKNALQDQVVVLMNQTTADKVNADQLIKSYTILKDHAFKLEYGANESRANLDSRVVELENEVAADKAALLILKGQSDIVRKSLEVIMASKKLVDDQVIELMKQIEADKVHADELIKANMILKHRVSKLECKVNKPTDTSVEEEVASVIIKLQSSDLLVTLDKMGTDQTEANTVDPENRDIGNKVCLLATINKDSSSLGEKLFDDDQKCLLPNSKSRQPHAYHTDKLYIDLLNYGNKFLPIFDWNLSRAYERIKNFIEAANNSGFFNIKCFIDDSNPSEEATKKWKTRREKEVRKGKKEVPQGYAILLGDMFTSCGIEVLYSDELDNDDTLAFYAHADEAILLSGDKDFFRYIDAKYVVYDVYSVTKNHALVLSQIRTAETIKCNGKAPHAIAIGQPPKTRQRVTQITGGIYKRGTPSPLMRKLNMSPHRILAPLRRAAFHLQGIEGPITETYPEWDEENKTVAWYYEQNIYPLKDDFYQNLLVYPAEAMKHFFPQECSEYNNQLGFSRIEWDKHVFCVQSLVYEIISIAFDVTLFELWMQHNENCQDTKQCVGKDKKQFVGKGSGRGKKGRVTEEKDNLPMSTHL